MKMKNETNTTSASKKEALCCLFDAPFQSTQEKLILLAK
jgi:hypothetical protein